MGTQFCQYGNYIFIKLATGLEIIFNRGFSLVLKRMKFYQSLNEVNQSLSVLFLSQTIAKIDPQEILL